MSADDKEKDPFTDDLFEEVDEVEDASALEIPEAEETDAIELADDELEELEPAEAEEAPGDDPFAEFAEPDEPSEAADPAPEPVAPQSDPMDLFDDPGEPAEAAEMSADDVSEGWGDAEDQFSEPADPDEPEAVEAQEPPPSTAALFDEVEPAAESGGFEEEYSITDKVRRSMRSGGGSWKERKGLIAGVAGAVVLAVGGGAFFLLGGDDPTPMQVTSPSAQQLPAPTDVAPEPEPVVDEPVGEEFAADPVDPEPVAVEEPAAPEPEPEPEPVAAPEPPPEPLGPASEIVDVQALANGNVLIRGDGEFRAVKYFGMQEPNRVVVDVYGVGRGFSGWNRPGEGPVQRIRPGIHPDRMRFVLDLADAHGPLPDYGIERDGNEVLVTIGR